jgi:hypothetical protein
LLDGRQVYDYPCDAALLERFRAAPSKGRFVNEVLKPHPAGGRTTSWSGCATRATRSRCRVSGWCRCSRTRGCWLPGRQLPIDAKPGRFRVLVSRAVI